MFVGEIPSELARLASLQFLDLAHNNLTGSIPRSFGNFSAMIYHTIHNYDGKGFSVDERTFTVFDYINNLLVVIQGEEYHYSTTVYLFKIMDLSENNLSGQIPEEIFAIALLRSLNLSGNHLTGMIPERLSDMRSLESLDLSLNELQGATPQSLSALTFLNYLNLSYNNLSGRIPTGNQLGTLDYLSIYIGNTYLCGPPTGKNCSENETIPNIVGDDDYDGSESTWPYLGMGLGFAAGFWGVCSILIFKESWSSAYFQMIDSLYDKIYVIIAISCQATLTSGCFEIERSALLAFKADVIDTEESLSSWAGQDCCIGWRGVVCNSNTGHVVKLSLRNSWLYDPLGEVSPSLAVLHHLVHLDLSSNVFSGSTVPEFVGSFKNLTHLDLSYSGFGGRVPRQLGNLFNLRFLDLSGSFFIGVAPPWLGNLTRLHALGLENAFPSGPSTRDLSWLSHLSSLRYLAMSYMDLSSAADWLQEVNKLKYITELSLEDCSLSSIPNSLSYVNFTSLRILKLRENGPFNVALPTWLWNLTNLSYLDLENGGFYGKIPDALGNLTSLSSLYLGENYFDGTVPESLGNLCNLQVVDLNSLNMDGDIAEVVGTLRCSWKSLDMLDLGNNELHGNLTGWLEQLENVRYVDLSNNSLVGPIPFGIRNLSNLVWLDLSFNSLHGVVSEAHLASLSSLVGILLSSNSLIVNVGDNWVPPFQLLVPVNWLGRSFRHGSGGRRYFSIWIYRTQASRAPCLNGCELSLVTIDLSYNQLVGQLPVFLQFKDLEILVLKSNRFQGLIPSLPKSLHMLDLSENSLSGPLPLSLNISQLGFLFLSSNKFNGSIPSYMCELDSLKILDTSNNSLSGELPRCWQNSSLQILDLSNNNLTGKIPASIGLLSSLKSLHLNDNRFHGQLPANLQHCKHLTFVDLSRNKLSGKIPTWMGENLQNLVVLQLRSNMFSGDIPEVLAQLPYLHVLDLAANNLSGPVPHSFGNFSAMIHPSANNYNPDEYKINLISDILFNFMDNLLLVMKRNEFRYSTILYLVKTIDISGNNLSGQIPEEIVALRMLQSLNLSRNHLTGWIPKNIGDMLNLESLDLSLNELSGAIPQSLSDLTFLSSLNLSYNNLSGWIPTGSQLDRLNDPSIYIGNYYLCGPPTKNNCSKDDTNPYPQRDDNNGTHETIWLYLGMGTGFATGLWGVYIAFLFRRSWRIAYFQMTDKLFDDIYVMVVLSWRRLKGKIAGQKPLS
ncbi:LRR receptor-like serine/threonine-protein kinase GSO1 [Ananas comosus]|uniref:LRR receptor-like serine/threonine-protein kinase GSO1 n=1 Tax=Ananas comosus TaxID=4615 RepID=A0A199VXU9_ANACO|nr:LRR receptor-like serine/threonine-protein kinase GSO1 [Ananas comosus]